MTILGIDPGSIQTGYGVIDTDYRVLAAGVLTLSGKHIERIESIYAQVADLVQTHQPQACAVEMPVYGNNPQSMLKLGRAQAAAMLAATHGGVAVFEYTPKMVKRAVVGNGNASKQQLAYMVRAMLKFDSDLDLRTFDETDALAIALCHTHRLGGSGSGPNPVYRDWDAFLKAHPERAQS